MDMAHRPLSTIFSVAPRKQGQLSIKVEVAEVKPVSYLGVKANLPDNIARKSGALLFTNMGQWPLYRLTTKLAEHIRKGGNTFPEGVIIEELKPPLCEIVISIEGNVQGIQWLNEASSMTSLAAALEELFVTESYLANLNVANVKLRTSVETDDVEGVQKEYERGQGFTDMPTINDIQLWAEIEHFHVNKVRQYVHWARETENWLESSLGSFLMTCKQLMPNNEPLTDAGKLERTASSSQRASVDKTGMTNFANAFRKIVEISIELNNEIIDKLNHTHRFEKKFPALYDIRTQTIDLITGIKRKYSVIMEEPIQLPKYEIYDPWRAKVLAKEAELYLPLVSIIPFFKDHLLDIDVHMDELKANLTSSFPNECRILADITPSQKPVKAEKSHRLSKNT